MTDYRKYAAEFLGTFVLVFGGTVGVVGAERASAAVGPGTNFVLLVVPFAFGLALLAGLYAFGEVSGGHFNPAVSLAMFLDKRLESRDLAGYWVAQFLGAIVASLLLLLLTNKAAVKSVATVPQPLVSNAAAFGFELAFTAIFVAVILQASLSERFGTSALLAIPLTLVAIHFTIIPFTGSSVNPARTFGPDLVGNRWTGIWIYLIAPPIGAAVGWAVHRYVASARPAPAGAVAEVLQQPTEQPPPR
jgi:aquaporin Z